MNQKQRDYLVKRLQKLAEEKKAAFRVEKPDVTPFIKKLKLKASGDLASFLVNKIIVEEDETWKDSYENKYIRGIEDSSKAIYPSDIYSNFREVSELAAAFCKKHYAIEIKRKESIDRKCTELSDKIVFADTYEEALKIIQEFSKF